MSDLDRSTAISVAIVVALGFAIWQVLSSIASIATHVLTEWWEDPNPGGLFGGEIDIGGVQIPYGQLLASLIALALGLLLATAVQRHAARRRGEPKG